MTISLEDIKKLKSSEVKVKVEIGSNEKCAKIIDIIYDKILEIMNKDKKTSGFEKALVIATTKRSAPGIKKYVLNIPKEDAQDIVNKVKSVLILELV